MPGSRGSARGFSPDGGVGAAAWWICRPGAACVPAPSADGWLKPGAASPARPSRRERRFRASPPRAFARLERAARRPRHARRCGACPSPGRWSGRSARMDRRLGAARGRAAAARRGRPDDEGGPLRDAERAGRGSIRAAALRPVLRGAGSVGWYLFAIDATPSRGIPRRGRWATPRPGRSRRSKPDQTVIRSRALRPDPATLRISPASRRSSRVLLAPELALALLERAEEPGREHDAHDDRLLEGHDLAADRLVGRR